MSDSTNVINKRKPAARHTQMTGGQPSITRSILSGLLWAAAAVILLLFMLALAVYSTDDPGSLVLPAALAALYISAFAGGLAAAWKNRGDALACGVLFGGAMFLVIIIISLIIPGGAASKFGFWTSAGMHALLIPFSLLGAYAGVSLRQSGSSRRRRRRR